MKNKTITLRGLELDVHYIQEPNKYEEGQLKHHGEKSIQSVLHNSKDITIVIFAFSNEDEILDEL